MSKIKILESNKNSLMQAQTLFQNILEMQSNVDVQIKSIKGIESNIVSIEREKQEKLAQIELKKQEEINNEEAKKATPSEVIETKQDEVVASVVNESTDIESNAIPTEKQTETNGTEVVKPIATEVKKVEEKQTSMNEKLAVEQDKNVNIVNKNSNVSNNATNSNTNNTSGNNYNRNNNTNNTSGNNYNRNTNANNTYGNNYNRNNNANNTSGNNYSGSNNTNTTSGNNYNRSNNNTGTVGNNYNGNSNGNTNFNRSNNGTGTAGNNYNRNTNTGNVGNNNYAGNNDRRGPIVKDDRKPFVPRTDGRNKRPGENDAPAFIEKTIKKDVPKVVKSDDSSKSASFDPRRKKSAEDLSKKPKKAVIKERVFTDDDEFPKGSKKLRYRKHQIPQKMIIETVKIEKAIMTEETISVKHFSEITGKPVSDLLKKLMLLNMLCTINSQVDFDTVQLVASDFDIEIELKLTQTAEDVLVEEIIDDVKDLAKRPPIVTIMGHVDHGKTSLLDKIRLTKVTEGEAGGITQHIGAYQVELHNDKITFIDTPGHEAFTAMRARGAQVTDIAIIVVAADDGIMPQTVEAINHAKMAKVPIIVAINKIDKENANIEKIMQEMTEHGLVAEEWGGDTIFVPVSAKTGQNIDKLMEMILLISEVQDLKANVNRLAKGTIVEAQLDRGRGPVATVLVETGTLRVGDTIIAGTAYGKVRALLDDMGKSVDAAYPSQPVEVIGFSEVPVAGDIMHAADQNKLTKKVSEERKDKIKADILKKMTKVTLDDLFNQIAEGQIKDLNIIIKADVQGSVEAIKQSLEKLSNEEVRVNAIHCGVGAIKETDVMLASASNAIIIGFNVRPDNMALAASEREKVDIRYYRIIYKAIEDITNAIHGMLEPEYEEAVVGHAEIRQTFKVSSIGTIAGCYVTDGIIKRSSQVRLLRDNVVIYEGTLSSLKRFKDDAKEVAQGYECGTSLSNYNDIRDLDVIECFEMKEIMRK